jgi:high-affinity iron transporter
MSYARIFLTVIFSLLSGLTAVHADDLTQTKAKQIWQLLDYLAVDYRKAVVDGVVASKTEYAEMQEFAHAALRQVQELPAAPARASLAASATTLSASIDAKAPFNVVSEQAHSLAAALLAAYPVPMAPSRLPDLARGAALYQASCTACHGATGHADGPLAATLSPPPIALADHARARERSVFSIQQIVTNGVQGTSMPAFATLSDDDRWAIAYFASTLSYSDSDRQAGAKLWAAQPALHAAVPTLAALTQSSEAALATKVGAGAAAPVMAYLRSSPEAVNAAGADSLPIATSMLAQSLAALEKKDVATASRLALSAYLDGFEPIEPALAAKDKQLFEEIEKGMGAYRNAVTAGDLNLAKGIESRLQASLQKARIALDSTNDPLSTFVGALTILLREGLEALLVVIAMVAFLKKAKRPDVLPYVHAGWITALIGGGLTWTVATYLVDLSGASREMTEGFSAVFAAVVLLGMGIWMHQKSMAGKWQAYVKEKLSAALSHRSAWMLFVLSFVTVYREVFETVLFYAALWTAENGIYLLAGLGSGIVILAAVGVFLLRSTARLPFNQFFAASSALMSVLAVVLIGKGIAALQKVGFLEASSIAFPRIDFLGIYPTTQSIGGQLVIVAIILAGITYNRRGTSNETRALAPNLRTRP